MADQGKIRLTIPDSSGRPQWSETKFTLSDEGDNAGAIRMFRPMGDGTTQEIVIAVTVNVIVPDPEEGTV